MMQSLSRIVGARVSRIKKAGDNNPERDPCHPARSGVPSLLSVSIPTPSAPTSAFGPRRHLFSGREVRKTMTLHVKAVESCHSLLQPRWNDRRLFRRYQVFFTMKLQSVHSNCSDTSSHQPPASDSSSSSVRNSHSRTRAPQNAKHSKQSTPLLYCDSASAATRLVAAARSQTWG
jgi:hypothetical protein